MKLGTPSVALLIALFVWTTPAQAEGWVSDGWITVRTKIALLTTQGMTATDIAVDTTDGRVSLYGKVGSASDKQRAEELTKELDGVKSVRNRLQVVPIAKAPFVAATDASIRSAVEEKLRADPKLQGTEIEVESVTNGVVLLDGEAENSAEHLRAIEVARSVRGVRRVESEVDTDDDDSSLDLWSRRELRQDGRGLLDVASDLWLTAEARLRLIADPRLPAPDIHVDCRDQVVTLFGEVPSPQAKRAAEQAVRTIDSVRSVKNDLQVVPASKRAAVHARDNELEQQVKTAIYSRPEMKRASISVSVQNRRVRLSGTVPSQQHRLFAASAAREVPGIRAVAEDLRVSSITEQTGPAPVQAH